jgi:DNA processing protein
METVRLALTLWLARDVTPRDWGALRAVSSGELAEEWKHDRLRTRLGRRVTPPAAGDIDRELERAARANARVLTVWDADYPPRLREVPDAPPVLFARGAVGCLATPSLAVVGTRAPSARGIAFAAMLGRAVAGSGVTVVSGLARGIDTAAHRGALDAAGTTVAVLGTGIDVVYPPENGALMERIAASGCVVSEQPCGTRGFASVFPRRNRIISGLSEGVVVVEGGVRSGALITARWALEQGRDVGAVPGFPGDFRSAGPNGLLRAGAFVVEDAVDIFLSIPALRVPATPAPAPERDETPDTDEGRILTLVGSDADVDEIATASGLHAGRVREILTRLEIEGRVTRDGLGRYLRARP